MWEEDKVDSIETNLTRTVYKTAQSKTLNTKLRTSVFKHLLVWEEIAFWKPISSFISEEIQIIVELTEKKEKRGNILKACQLKIK